MDAWLRPGRIAAVALAITALSALSGALIVQALPGLERTTLEARFGARGTTAADPRIVVIGIDERTLAAEQLPSPYPRDLHAQALAKLTRAGARSVAYDLAFTGRTDDFNDPRLLEALKVAPRPVVGVVGVDPSTGAPELLAGQEAFPWGQTLPGNTSRGEGDSPSWTDIPSRRDGIDAFPVVAAAQFRGRAPVPAPAGALVDYPGPSAAFGFASWSFSALLNDEIPAAALRDKVVVVGNTAAQLQDVHRTPFGVRPGPEIQAAAIATALQGYPLRRAAATSDAAATTAAAAAVPVLGLLLVLLPGRRRRAGHGSQEQPPLGTGSVVVAGGIAALCWIGATVVAFNAGTVLDLSSGLFAIVTATGAAVVLARVAERRYIARLRQQFAEGRADLIDGALTPDFETGPVAELAHVVDGITLLERCTEGTSGIVYRARQDLIDREIALKLIRPSLVASEAARALFQTEARALGRLWHPHVVPVFEVGDDRDIFYIAMRWIGGGDASRLDLPLAPAAAVTLVEGVASALDAAHEAGIVHGDVKPENVLLDPERPSHAYLIDFGVALIDAGAGRPAGLTPHYASPEALIGGRLTASSDIYSLGVLAFLLLSGELPFEGDGDQLAISHASAERPRASDYNGALPSAVDRVLARALAIEPGDRQPTAGALARELSAVLDAEISVA